MTPTNLISHYENRRLGSRDFIIISNNCWGFECYKTLNREYNTPFVGLYLYPLDYLKLLKNFERLRGAALSFVGQSRHLGRATTYPIGVVFDDVEIHFMHFGGVEEAREKWTRRLARMTKSLSEGAGPIFKMCDRDGCATKDLEAFHSLSIISSHKRVSFGAQDLPNSYHIQVPKNLCEGEKQVVDGRTLYLHRYKMFDFAEWMVSGKIRKSIASRLLAMI